jgi:CHAD domain-containing protein
MLPLHFEFPQNLTAKKFLARLSKKFGIQIVSQQYAIKTFYDTFDWRLYRTGIICEFNQSQALADLRLIDKATGVIIASEEMSEVPKFSGQFNSGKIKQQLEPVMQMRALSPLCQLPLETISIHVLNKNQKIILRLQVDEYEFLPNRVCLYPLKGYDKIIESIHHFFTQSLALQSSHYTALKAALKEQGRKPKDYHSKLAIKLAPDMRADKASKIIYQHLLQAIQVNEIGTIADIDSEFLHDFRVAIRRTRAGLSQIKGTLPEVVTSQYSEFFAGLGQITGLTRDLDVYLLSYENYKAALPLSVRDDLEPLYSFLKKKQGIAQKQLVKQLSSSAYRKGLLNWEQYLSQPLTKKHSGLTIKEVADLRIWRVYKRVIKEGSVINDSSPAEALHDLRKTCKKLRYLLEFFQSLYPETVIKEIIKSLKDFQTVLGDFQDYEVQEKSIKQFSEEMREDKNISAKTFLSMGVLVQHLDAKRCKARHDFSDQFVNFKKKKNKQAFKQLFSGDS